MTHESDSEVILVSGGTRGLGHAIAAALLAGGRQVATFGRTRSEAIDALAAEYGERFAFSEVDASEPAELAKHAAAVAERFGRIDALINNAGFHLEGLFTLARASDIHRLITVNLEGAMLLAQACAKVMLRQHRGHIINISSVNAISGHRGVAAYSATKAGLDGLTRSLARELGARGIRVNSIAPGYLDTDMTKQISAEQRDQIMRRTPLGRLGTVDDVVGVIEFLLSPAAKFITGQTLVVDGGLAC